MPQHTAHLSRHGHDLSESFGYSAAPGMILPVFHDLALPGESYYFKDLCQIRFNPMQTAFFGDVHFEFDWFFVPLPMLFTPFEALTYKTLDFTTDYAALTQPQSQSSSLIPVPPYSYVRALQQFIPPTLGSNPSYFEDPLRGAMRLLNHLGLNPYAVFNSNVNMFPGQTVAVNHYTGDLNDVTSPWFLASYQAIYAKYFRNDNRERLFVQSYNFDSEYSNALGAPFARPDLLGFHYCQRSNDLFSDLKPNPIISAINNIQVSGDEGSQAINIFQNVNKFLAISDTYAVDDNAVDTPAAPVSTITDYASQYTDTSMVSANQIRQLFAVDKLMRITGRADKNYDAQILAHFGFKVPHDVKHQISHIGHSELVMNASPLESTANTYDASSGLGSPLGEIGASAFASHKGRAEKFTAPCHGVIMCVQTSWVAPYYFNTYDPLNDAVDPSQFPQPEFDKLGMEPVFYWYLNQDYNATITPAPQTTYYIAGWQKRYYAWKQKVNRLSVVFDPVPGQTSQGSSLYNSYSPWFVSMNPLHAEVSFANGAALSKHTITADDFLQDPCALNGVMFTPFFGGWKTDFLTKPWEIFYTDPFIMHYRAEVKKVSAFSEMGEPDL